MKRHALFFALLCLSSLLISASKLNALTIPASEDSYTAPGNKLSLATNNANSLVVDASRKSYLYFDLSDIPIDTVVRWAKLRLFLPIVQRPGAGLSVHVVNSEWNESKASTSLPTLVPGTIGVITPDKMASRRFVTIDVTSTVQKWIKGGTINGGTMNEGFAVQPIVKAGSPTASVMLTSKEGPVFGLPAELDIEFQPEGGVDKPVTVDQLPPIGYAQLSSSFKTFLSPTVTVQPVIPQSFSGSLSVQAQGVGNLAYQWMRNGIAIVGGTNSQLPVGNGLQSGTYTVAVSNGVASVTSEGVRITIMDSLGVVFVSGGTLPASSQLGAVPVETFYIGKTEVTWKEWVTVRDWAVVNGYDDLAGVGQGVWDNYPVTHVNWYDVVKWCNARSEKDGRTPVYRAAGEVYRSGQSTPDFLSTADGYRLPSDAEWEFAARGGLKTQGFRYSGSEDLGSVAWYSANSSGLIQHVGKKLPNELGLYDMSGNVWEWCGNVPGWTLELSSRVTRGGDFGTGTDWDYCQVSDAFHANSSDLTYFALGFRVATSGEYALGITAQPSVSLDGTTLSVDAAGAGTLTYQWSLNRVPIAGGTSSQLSTQGLQSGTYTVVVSNGFASKTSAGIQYPIGTFALVTGGTLPASSLLGAVSVETFYIGRTEVTWKEWVTIRGWAVEHGYDDLAGVGQGVGDNYPVTHVNWYDVVKWCNARSEKEGKTPVYKNGTDVYRTGVVADPQVLASANGYRLPQEQEWEHAARGGTQTKGYTYSGSNNLDDVGWYAGNSGGTAHEVGKKLANELGLFDMSCNVWEYCGSWHPEYVGLHRVLKGGVWGGLAEGYAVDYRIIADTNLRGYDYGFRVATSGEYALGITAQPSLSADGTKISVQADGAGTLTYQWMRNGVAVSGGTSSQLPTEGLESGTYTVVVSNGFASKTSGGIQYPIGTFALVTGGTLPASSPLGAVPVDTFYIGRTEVTWGEWQAVRTWAVVNGYTDLAEVGQGVGDNYPVTYVNWYDVVKWCNARSEKEGKTPVYKNGTDVYRTGDVSEPAIVASANGFRLPSEKEWEFAARGGTQTQGYTYSGSNDLNEVGWYTENSGGTVKEVGQKQTNELGIYDMSGNLSEWSGSWIPGSEGYFKALRGGYWNGHAEYCTVASRGYINPGHRDIALSFRVATSGEYALGITLQPVMSSDGANISVQAEGSGTLTYQWMRDGVAITGGTSSQLAMQGLPSGTYTVVVSNGFASVTSVSIQYSPIGTFAIVVGGTLPASSSLGALPVDTFYIGRTEVTWGEWQTVRTWAVVNGYADLEGVGQGVGDSYPVSDVSWYDVVKWCNARSEKEGKTPVYKNGTVVYRTGVVSEPAIVASANGYRLPSEKEWEFAARGGTQTQGYTYSGSNDLSLVGWYAANSGNVAKEVGKKHANELGIYDMSGNLFEWSGSWYPGDEGSYRVIRGGNWLSLAGYCTVAYRYYVNPEPRNFSIGFRLALSSVP